MLMASRGQLRAWVHPYMNLRETNEIPTKACVTCQRPHVGPTIPRGREAQPVFPRTLVGLGGRDKSDIAQFPETFTLRVCHPCCPLSQALKVYAA